MTLSSNFVYFFFKFEGDDCLVVTSAVEVRVVNGIWLLRTVRNNSDKRGAYIIL